MLVLSCRKELKDPDQLYNTLKNLLAQIKVQAAGDPLLRGACPPPTALRAASPGTGCPGLCSWGACGVTQACGEQDPCVLGQAGAGWLPVLAAVTCPPPSPQTHPSAWPFMEPVKKSEAPDYYEIIRFPIGMWLCPEPWGRMAEGGLQTPCLRGLCWGGGVLAGAMGCWEPQDSPEGRRMSWDP